MELSEWVIYTVAEVLLVLVITCVLLLLHTRGLKALIGTLQSKLAKAVNDLRDAKKQQSSTTSDASYADQLEAHLKATSEFHKQHGADRPIEQDITANTPNARLVAAMRHRFLKAEQEATSESLESPNWQRIAEHYSQLPAPQVSDEPQIDVDPEELLKLSYDEQRDEIERFKRLFTTMEAQWQAAKVKAENYYAQLMNMIGESEEPRHLALKQLAEEQLAYIDQVTTKASTKTDSKIGHQDLDKLKAINERQKDEIAELQLKLANASSDEERLSVTEDLERQLAQQLRFMKESEICIDLLERELEDASRRISQLEARKTPSAVAEQTALIESKQHLNKQIRQLQGENEQLVNLAEHADAEQRRIVAAKNKEVEALKSKFSELARRYKALASKSKET